MIEDNKILISKNQIDENIFEYFHKTIFFNLKIILEKFTNYNAITLII
jgi:hypothetical protein